MKKGKSFFIIYILVVLILILSSFEFLILPWHFNMPRDLALLGFSAKPNITIDDTSINSMGFAGDVIDNEKSSEKIRILTLGGSAMFNRRMVERLKSGFNSVSERPVEVLGAALRNHTTMSSLIKYRFLSKYKFDYVITYHAINDLFVNHVYADHFKSDYSHMMPWYRRNILLDHSLIARVIYNNFIWGRRIFGMEKVWFIWPKKDMENAMGFVSEKLFRRNMTSLVEEIKRDGAVPVLMTFAWNIPDSYSLEAFESKTVGYNNPTNYDRYPVELWGSTGFVREGMQRHNAVLRNIADTQDVFLIDQQDLIGKDLYMFGDVCHLSEEGTDIFIQNITDFFLVNDLLN